MELHHPIMSKLWDLGGRTKKKEKNTHFLLHLYIIPFFVLPIAHNHKIQIQENLKLAKSKKKTEEEAVIQRLTKKT